MMIRRAAWFAAAALAACGMTARAQDPEPAEEKPPSSPGGLEAAADLCQDWISYSFTVEIQIEGAGKPGKKENHVADGVWVKDKGLFVKAGSVQAVRTATRSAIRGEDGAWKALASGKDGGAKGDKGRKQERAVAAVAAPTKDLVDVEMAFESIEAAADGGLSVYSGKLTAEGASQLLGSAARRYLRAEGAEASASARISVDGSGNIAEVRVRASIKTRVKDQEVEVTIVKRIAIAKVAASDFEIPEEAKKILEG